MANIKLREKTHITLAQKNLYVSFRYINVQSLETNESINIGLIWQTLDYSSPNIDIFTNLKMVHDFFPIFDINHVKTCKNLIKIKYKLNKVDNKELKITSTIKISNLKVYYYAYEGTQKPSKLEIQSRLSTEYLTLTKTKYKIDKYIQKSSENLRDIIFNTAKEVLDIKPKKKDSTKLLIENIKLAKVLEKVSQRTIADLKKIKVENIENY